MHFKVLELIHAAFYSWESPFPYGFCCPLYVVCLKSREEEQGIQLNCIWKMPAKQEVLIVFYLFCQYWHTDEVKNYIFYYLLRETESM